MGHIQDLWFRPKRDPDTGERLFGSNGRPLQEKTPIHGKGDRYRVRYRDPSGKERSRTFPDKKKRAAEDWLHKIEDEMNRGSYLDPNAGKIPFREYAEKWVSSHDFEESTRELTAYRLKLHVYEYLGDKYLDAIRPSDIREWSKALEDKGLAASYRQVLFIHVQTVLNAAVDDEKIKKNPCNAPSVRKPQIEPKKIVPWTTERVRVVQGAMADRYKITVPLGAGLGLRQGEVFGLAVDDIDFEDDTVHIVRQVKVVHQRPCFGPPKRGKTREVPLPATVADALRSHLDSYPPISVTLPWKHPGGVPVTARLIVYSRERTAAWRPVYNQWAWEPALKKAGVQRVPRRDGFHALRHFYASTLLDAGETITALAQYLGHSDPAFTLKVYTHLMPSSKHRTRRAVDAVFGEPSGELPDAA
ncbi:site-specific recombinase XerD [Tamaricihabitans halophyticus]|uniref:Site-specific recombinase XerD n=1 Tax=Tamaricihabitans halophyticus TaxID=1262583 RepID=A0A4R2RB88_9PSEU|nr:site-specific integrase [Tamaricihabitans halophyticus]TCP56685.1 site-specific recombinase XerD [Tamaricihabitans halophyticus]